MKHDRATALTTGLGALGAVVTMVLHPTHGIHGLEGEAMLRAARFAAAVHGLAIASLATQLCGAWGIADRLGSRSWQVRAGFVAFAFAAVWGSIAATISALTAPHVAARLVDVEPALGEARRSAAFLLRPLVAAFTDVLIVGLAVTPLLWARPLARESRLLAVAGALVGALGLVAYLAGVLVDEVGPLGAFVTAFAAWLVAVAVWLWRTAR
ncbi:MAG: hypothetical protein AAF957_19635 [Planctomycetota bacterium]